MRILARVFLSVMFALLMSGCRLTVGVDVTVDADAGGSLSVSVTSDGELNNSVAEAAVDPLTTLVDRVEGLDGPWRVEDRTEESGARTVTLSTGFDDPAGFDLRYGELRQALDAPEARLLGPLTLSVDPETGVITVDGDLPLQLNEVAAADLGTDVASLTEELGDVVSTSVSVTTPGRLLEVTGLATVQTDEGAVRPPYPDGPVTVSWISIAGGVTPIDARFEPGGPDLVRLALLGGAGLLALGLVAGGVAAQRRR